MSVRPLTERRRACVTVLTPAGGHSERRMSQVLTRRFTSTRGRARVPGVLGVRSGEEELAAEAPALSPAFSAGTAPRRCAGAPHGGSVAPGHFPWTAFGVFQVSISPKFP